MKKPAFAGFFIIFNKNIDLDNMSKISVEKLLYESESSSLDFKEEAYKFIQASDKDKSELLKDILAFANSWRRENAYILLGIREVSGGKNIIVGTTSEIDDAQLQQFINSKTQRPISFSLKYVLQGDKTVAMITIPVQQRPFYLLKDYGKLRKGLVYIRRSSSTEIATPDEIFSMGETAEKESDFIPEIKLVFADKKNRLKLGNTIDLKATLLDSSAINEVPDFTPSQPKTAIEIAMNMHEPHYFQTPNKSYYRDLVKYYTVKNFTRSIEFSIVNESNVTIPDVLIEIYIKKLGRNFKILTETPIPDVPKSHSDSLALNVLDTITPRNVLNKSDDQIYIEELSDKFFITINHKKIQPKQTVFIHNTLYISIFEDLEIDGEVEIFADNISKPIKQKLSINCCVDKKSLNLSDIISKLDI